MKNLKILLFVFYCQYSFDAFSQKKAELIRFSNLEKFIQTDRNDIFVINFWATWCGPCLAELPDFQHFYQKNTNKNVKLLLVSLDFPNEINKVNIFIQKKKLMPTVYLISDTDQNAFINQVNRKWEGTIPATWFVNNKNGKKLFIEKPINEKEINKYIAQIQ